MSAHYSRRQALKMGLGSLGSLTAFGVAGCNTPSSLTSNPSAKLQMIFWGETTRDMVTRQAIEIFEKSHPTITITSHLSSFESYWTKLNTMATSNSLPDLVQMDVRYVSEYVSKGFLLDLTSFISNQTINLTDFDPLLLTSSKINNTVYGVPIGGNYQCYFYNQSLIEQANVGTLPQSMTWKEFGIYTSQLTRALGQGVYGTTDNSGNINDFELWVRQYNKELYTLDGHLGFDEPIVAEWFNYWSQLRQAGSCPPMTIQSGRDGTGNPGDSSVVTGKAVFSMIYSNQHEAWQKATQYPLGLMVPPTGSAPGMYLKASQLLSISAKTQYPTESAIFSNFIITDAGAVKALGIERGVPDSRAARTLLGPRLTAEQKTVMAYIDKVSKSPHVRAKHVLDPPGAGEIANILDRISQAIGFGKMSIQDGAKSFYADAQKALMSS